MATGMEKRSRGADRRLGLVCLGVSLGACLCLALAIAGLEVSRSREMEELRARLEGFRAESLEMMQIIENLYNTTQTLLKEAKEENKVTSRNEEYYDDEYDYDDDSYDEYDDEEDKEEAPRRGGHPKKEGNGTAAAVGRRRGRRSVPTYSRYHVKIAKGSKYPQPPSPMSVQARIFVEKPADLQKNNYEGFGYTEEYVDRTGRKTDRVKESDCAVPKAAQFFGEIIPRYHHRSRHYAGGSRLSHPGGFYRDWKPSPWVQQNSDFRINSSRLIVNSPGLYYIYAQIYYKDTRDTFGFKIMKNNDVEFHCAITAMTPLQDDSERNGHPQKGNTCYTGGLTMMRAGDEVWLKEMEGERFVFHERTKSFFGMFRIVTK